MNIKEWWKQFEGRVKYSVELIDERPDDIWEKPKKPWEKPFHYRCTFFRDIGQLEFTCEYSKGCGNGFNYEAWMRQEGPALKPNTALYSDMVMQKWHDQYPKDHFRLRPTVEELLDCIKSDIADVLYKISFEDWADNLGYDTDSRKAEKTYNTITEQYRGMVRVFGYKSIKQLIEDVDFDDE